MSPKRGQLLDRTVQNRDARVFVVATEGAVDEPSYFTQLQRNGTIPANRIKLHLIPTPHNGRSDPEGVFDRLVTFTEDTRLLKEDECWLVLDVDRWPKLPVIAQFAKERSYGLAISNPCFEIWLLCHFPDASLDGSCQELKPRKGKLIAEIPIDERWPADSVAAARERARDLDTWNSWMPDEPGTNVYKLIDAMR